MTSSPTILAFAGSARQESLNRKLIRVAAGMAEDMGATVTVADMADYDAPLFNEDLETASGMPDSMQRFKVLMMQADGFLVSTPEYNGFFPALIKNTFDWCTRNAEGEAPMAPTMGKRIGIMGSSPGGLGGIRAIPRLRDCMAEYGVIAVPGFATVPNAYGAYDDDGNLTNEQTANTVKGVVQRLVDAVR